jgi:CHASE2 domain-containing sensor protein
MGFRNRPFLVAPALAVLIYLLHFFHLVDFHELDAIDLRFRIRGEQQSHPDIVLIEIDDGSVAAVGQWPWPRSIHAVLIDLLTRYKARLIFYDVLFTEAGPEPKDDEALAFAVKQAGNVILPFYYHSEEPFDAFFPIPSLSQAAKAVSYVNTEPDRDGSFRRIRLSLKTPEGTFYHTSVITAGLGSAVAGRSIPTDSDGYFWINYPGSIRAFKRISSGELIASAGTDREKQMQELFHDRIVLIGHTATGSTDLKPAPFSHAEPGIAIQASAIHTLLMGNYPRSVSEPLHLLLLIVLSLLVAWSTQVSSPVKGLLLAFGIMISYGLVNYLLFLGLGWMLPLFVPFVTVAVTYVLLLFWKYMEIRFEEELLQRELTTAARIQQAFLPQEKPALNSLDVSFECRFAEQVGGDFYDWHDWGEGRLGVCVGDVSGKGVPAALYMARALNDLRREENKDLPPNELCKNINTFLSQSADSGMFMTFLYVTVDTARRKISYCNAGHEFMILYRERRGEAEILKGAQGTPLGIFSESDYETADSSFEPGDLFLLISDGVKELRNPRGEELGMERLREFLTREGKNRTTAKGVIEGLFKRMQEHQKGRPPHDDRTLVCVRFLP